jgi:hypothetical protein
VGENPSMHWFRGQSGCVVLLILIGISGVAVFDLAIVTVGDGSIPFEVHIKSSPGREISRVSYATLVGDKSTADELNKQISIYKDALVVFRQDDEIRDNPFTVHMPSSEHVSGLGRTLRYTQLRILALKIEFADGQIEYRIVWMPDGREQRKIEVEVP